MFKDEYRQLRKVKSIGNETFSNEYWPELEKSDELIPDLVLHYMQLIEILRWEVDLGSIGIFTEVVVMSQYLASPLLGHIEGLYNIFEYIIR